jgi:hypothetical protein
MARHDESETRALADRLVNYADALVALAVVGVSGLGLAVADPETRGDIARAADWIIASNLISGVILTVLVAVLRRWELDLRSENPPAQKARRYSRRLHVARIVVVWLASAQAVLLMVAIR